ncbi:MAG: alpha/beta hydrolase [Rhizobiaceae bacterium]
MIETEDGLEIPATLFERIGGKPGDGPVVLISSATAVPRQAYRRFAQYLAEHGARAVMTYDYRGMGAPLPRGMNRKVRMADWATRDMPAAVKFLARRFPDFPIAGLGHSFGGQALGLSGTSDRFIRYMTLAAGSGFLGHTREREKLSRTMNMIGFPIAATLGLLPGWAGMGKDIPFGAFNQWRRWCNSPDYFMNDPDVPETSRFADVHTPMMAVGFDDDPWATRESTEALVSWYASASPKIRWFTVEERKIPVGHFGFFRPDHQDTLWPQVADWLVRD